MLVPTLERHCHLVGMHWMLEAQGKDRERQGVGRQLGGHGFILLVFRISVNGYTFQKSPSDDLSRQQRDFALWIKMSWSPAELAPRLRAAEPMVERITPSPIRRVRQLSHQWKRSAPPVAGYRSVLRRRARCGRPRAPRRRADIARSGGAMLE